MTPKKFHRFLLPKIPHDFKIEDSHTIHQAFSVLKLKAGEHMIIFEDGGPDIETEIISIHKKGLVLKKVSEKEVSELPKKIIMALSITKGASFEFAIQKLTEIGVREIIPILSSRTVKQNIRLERLQRISDEALEQSGGNNRVKIYKPMTLSQVFENFNQTKIVLDAYDKSDDVLDDEVIIFVGPEGGWSQKDKEVFDENNHLKLSLGTKILRSETAAIVAAHRILW